MDDKIRAEVLKVIHGKDEIVDKVMMTILAGGHVLLEDIPGVGKTTLANAFAEAMNLTFKRVSFNPDVLPSDITGFSIFNKSTGQFEFRPGAIMCNLFLADEINRTFSKTQAALLEVMGEGNVTVDGITYELPKPFIVIATSNPVGATGTQNLPESQLDRFMVCLKMGYPDSESQMNILKNYNSENPLKDIKRVSSAKDIISARKKTDSVFVSDEVLDYIIRLCEATRKQGNIELGVSPRGILALTKLSKACAFLNDRNFVIPEDVKYCFKDVVRHRIILDARSRINGVSVSDILDMILNEIKAPMIGEDNA